MWYWLCTSSLRSHNLKSYSVCASRILNRLTQKIQTVCKIVFQVNNLTRKKRRNIFVWRISCPFPIPNCKLLSFSKGGRVALSVWPTQSSTNKNKDSIKIDTPSFCYITKIKSYINLSRRVRECIAFQGL